MSDFDLQGLAQVSISTDIPAHRRIVDGAISEITTLRKQLAESQARVAELSELVSEAHDLFEGILDGSYEPDSFTIQPYKFAMLEDNSRPWLLRRNAEAVEVAADKYGSIGDSPFRHELFLTLKDYAQRLRQQADEAERAGGEK